MQSEKRIQQLELGEQLKEEAIDQVEESNAIWVKKMLRVVQSVAIKYEHFTTDRVWHYAERLKGYTSPSEPRAMGAVMRSAVSSGICEATDRTKKSVRPDCHSRPVRVWRSKIFRESS